MLDFMPRLPLGAGLILPWHSLGGTGRLFALLASPRGAAPPGGWEASH